MPAAFFHHLSRPPQPHRRRIFLSSVLPIISPAWRTMDSVSGQHAPPSTACEPPPRSAPGRKPPVTPLRSRFWPQAIENRNFSRFSSAQTSENKDLLCRIYPNIFFARRLPGNHVYKPLARNRRSFRTGFGAKTLPPAVPASVAAVGTAFTGPNCRNQAPDARSPCSRFPSLCIVM